MSNKMSVFVLANIACFVASCTHRYGDLSTVKPYNKYSFREVKLERPMQVIWYGDPSIFHFVEAGSVEPSTFGKMMVLNLDIGHRVLIHETNFYYQKNYLPISPKRSSGIVTSFDVLDVNMPKWPKSFSTIYTSGWQFGFNEPIQISRAPWTEPSDPQFTTVFIEEP